MKWPICLYPNYGSADPLAGVVNKMSQQLGDMFNGRLDGANVDPSMFDPTIFAPWPLPPAPQPLPPPPVPPVPNNDPPLLWWSPTFPIPPVPPFLNPEPIPDVGVRKVPIVTVPIHKTRTGGASTGKRDANGVARGVEIEVDSTHATDGRVCVIDKAYPAQQLLSLVPDNPAAIANPGAKVQTNYGALTLKAASGYKVQIANGADPTKILALDVSALEVGTSTLTVPIGGGTIEVTANKNAASGYAGLDAGGLVAVAHGGTGLSTVGTLNMLPRCGASTLVDSALSDDGTTLKFVRDTTVFGALGTAATVKATVTGTLTVAGGEKSGAITVRGGDPGAAFPGQSGGPLVARGGDTSDAAPGGAATFRAGNSATGTSGDLDIQTTAGASRGKITGADGVLVLDAFKITDAKHVTLGTGTGTKIGTSTAQKIGLWNTTPVVQPAAYTVTNPVVNRSINVSTITLALLAQVVGTLIADHQSYGAIG